MPGLYRRTSPVVIAEITEAVMANVTSTMTAEVASAVASEIETAIGASNNIIGGLNTDQLYAPGLFAYISDQNTVGLASSHSLQTANVIGASVEIGLIICAGVVEEAQFTTSSGIPTLGRFVYLASAYDEPGAAGKLRATPPTTGVVLPVGICLSNANYNSRHIARILLSPQEPILL